MGVRIMGIEERRAREFHRREREILAAALTLFSRDDWELVTVDQIAKQAEIGKGTIYKHFESKDEIYARLALDFNRALLQQFRQVDASLSVTERYREMTQLAWDAHLASKELHRVVLFSARSEFRQRLPAAMAAEYAAIERETQDMTLALFQQGMEEGLFPRKPIEHLMVGAQSAFWGAVQLIWIGYLGEPDKALYGKEISNFILAGLMFQDRAAEK